MGKSGPHHKERVDVLLVQQGYFPTREKAKRAIMAGLVFSQSDMLDKPGLKVPADTELHVKEHRQDFVSRGGFKLEKALRVFDVELAQQVVLDIGASTGGFTDCALQNGARLVYAVDVGYGQLDWKLRNDSRVVVMERRNFRHMTAGHFPERPDVATIDVSFISLGIILETLHAILQDGGHCVALVKPQFEVGKANVGKKGIVKDRSLHEQVLREMVHKAGQLGYVVRGLDYSPITGGDGNIEFLLHIQKKTPALTDDPDEVKEMQQERQEQTIKDIVRSAHQNFEEKRRI